MMCPLCESGTWCEVHDGPYPKEEQVEIGLPETITMRKWQVMEYLRECLDEIERRWREEI